MSYVGFPCDMSGMSQRYNVPSFKSPKIGSQSDLPRASNDERMDGCHRELQKFSTKLIIVRMVLRLITLASNTEQDRTLA